MTETTKPSAGDDTVSFGERDVPRADKAGLVRGVFDAVASRYDLMNDLMSGGVHRVWKDMTVAKVNPQPGEHLVDIAGGTGDIARRWLKRGGEVAERRGGPAPTALVIDINEEMIRAGVARGGEDGLSWAVGDAERLPLPDASAHAVTIGFGIRNVTDRAAALADMRRVLRPGGRLSVLEFSKPTSAALDAAYEAWSTHVIPQLGQAFAGDRSSYDYLVESIRRFPDQSDFAAEVEAAGFASVTVTNFAGGIAALHLGWRL